MMGAFTSVMPALMMTCVLLLHPLKVACGVDFGAVSSFGMTRLDFDFLWFVFGCIGVCSDAVAYTFGAV